MPRNGLRVDVPTVASPPGVVLVQLRMERQSQLPRAAAQERVSAGPIPPGLARVHEDRRYWCVRLLVRLLMLVLAACGYACACVYICRGDDAAGPLCTSSFSAFADAVINGTFVHASTQLSFSG